jgi:hypothetical protein
MSIIYCITRTNSYIYIHIDTARPISNAAAAHPRQSTTYMRNTTGVLLLLFYYITPSAVVLDFEIVVSSYIYTQCS